MYPTIPYRNFMTTAFAALFCFYGSSIATAQTDSVWNGGSGNWNVAGNWSPSGIPNGMFNVFIDDGNAGNSIVTIPASQTFTVDSLTIDAGDMLQQANNSRLIIQQDNGRPASGMITNNGDILVSNSFNNTDINIDTTVILSGSGTLTLGGGSTVSRIFDGVGSSGSDGILTIIGGTIQGKGQIGVNTLQVINEADGVIVANDASGSLTLDPRTADPMINMGLLQADGGNLVLTTGDYNNAGGTIEALASSTVTLTGSAAVSGGILQTSGDGQFEVPPSQTASISDLTVNGTLNSRNNTNLTLDGTIFNQGDVNIVNAFNITDLLVDTAVSLEGGGTITLGGGSSTTSRILDAVDGDGVLTNINNLIQGKGQIGVNTLQVINEADGVIAANDASSTLTLDPRDADPMINMGLMQADAGGILVLNTGDYNNAGGTIEALSASTVSLNGGAVISGGILQSSGDGQIEVPQNQTATISDLIFNGTLNSQNNTNLTLDGTIFNQGDVNIVNAFNNTDLVVNSPVVVTGPGSINLAGGSATTSRIFGTGNLEIAGGTLAGRGTVLVPTVFDDATLAPGTSIGTLNFSAPSLVRGDSVFQIELNSVNGTPGTNSDWINSSSTIDLQQSGASEYTVALVTLDGNGDPGPLEVFDPAQNFIIRIANASSFLNYSAGDFELDLSGFANAFTGEFSVTRGPFGSGEALFVKYGPFKLGDVNQDGAVNLLDVATFVEILSSGKFVGEADINCDGAVSLLDIAPFVDLLASG